MDFSDCVVLITGGASGIGAACVSRFARDGARVVVADLDLDLARRVAAGVGGQVRAVRVDVADADEMRDCVDEIARIEGRLDIAVNNAGISGYPALLHETPPELVQRVMATNFFGVFNGMRAEIPAMLGAGGGVIVNMASISAVTGLPFGSAYTASKHAVLGLTRAAALEYSSSGIRVVAVCPGVIDTPITSHLPKEIVEAHLRMAIDAQAIKRSGEPAEVAAMVCFLASAEASFITGSAHLVDGGYVAA